VQVSQIAFEDSPRIIEGICRKDSSTASLIEEQRESGDGKKSIQLNSGHLTSINADEMNPQWM
jgi:hypothetical protein